MTRSGTLKALKNINTTDLEKVSPHWGAIAMLRYGDIIYPPTFMNTLMNKQDANETDNSI
jgi:hypothetical protein